MVTDRQVYHALESGWKTLDDIAMKLKSDFEEFRKTPLHILKDDIKEQIPNLEGEVRSAQYIINGILTDNETYHVCNERHKVIIKRSFIGKLKSFFTLESEELIDIYLRFDHKDCEHFYGQARSHSNPYLNKSS